MRKSVPIAMHEYILSQVTGGGDHKSQFAQAIVPEDYESGYGPGGARAGAQICRVTTTFDYQVLPAIAGPPVIPEIKTACFLSTPAAGIDGMIVPLFMASKTPQTAVNSAVGRNADNNALPNAAAPAALTKLTYTSPFLLPGIGKVQKSIPSGLLDNVAFGRMLRGTATLATKGIPPNQFGEPSGKLTRGCVDSSIGIDMITSTALLAQTVLPGQTAFESKSMWPPAGAPPDFFGQKDVFPFPAAKTVDVPSWDPNSLGYRLYAEYSPHTHLTEAETIINSYTIAQHTIPVVGQPNPTYSPAPWQTSGDTQPPVEPGSVRLITTLGVNGLWFSPATELAIDQTANATWPTMAAGHTAYNADARLPYSLSGALIENFWSTFGDPLLTWNGTAVSAIPYRGNLSDRAVQYVMNSVKNVPVPSGTSPWQGASIEWSGVTQLECTPEAYLMGQTYGAEALVFPFGVGSAAQGMAGGYCVVDVYQRATNTVDPNELAETLPFATDTRYALTRYDQACPVLPNYFATYVTTNEFAANINNGSNAGLSNGAIPGTVGGNITFCPLYIGQSTAAPPGGRWLLANDNVSGPAYPAVEFVTPEGQPAAKPFCNVIQILTAQAAQANGTDAPVPTVNAYLPSANLRTYQHTPKYVAGYRSVGTLLVPDGGTYPIPPANDVFSGQLDSNPPDITVPAIGSYAGVWSDIRSYRTFIYRGGPDDTQTWVRYLDNFPVKTDFSMTATADFQFIPKAGVLPSSVSTADNYLFCPRSRDAIAALCALYSSPGPQGLKMFAFSYSYQEWEEFKALFALLGNQNYELLQQAFSQLVDGDFSLLAAVLASIGAEGRVAIAKRRVIRPGPSSAPGTRRARIELQ